MKLSVPDMSCGHCKATIERAIAALDAVARVRVDLDRREVEVDTSAQSAAVVRALEAEGYAAVLVA